MLDFPIIDSHIHLLNQRRFGYSWAAGAPALKRDWTPDDLAAAAKPYEIDGASLGNREDVGRQAQQVRLRAGILAVCEDLLAVERQPLRFAWRLSAVPPLSLRKESRGA